MAEATAGLQGIELRPLTAADRAELELAFAALSPRSRYSRFLSVKLRLTADDLRFLLGADGQRHVALGAWESGHLVAVGRFIRLEAGTAEASVAVIDAVHGRGIGGMLLAALRRAALELGIRQFTGPVEVDNIPMLQLLRKLGAHIGLASRGVREAELPLM